MSELLEDTSVSAYEPSMRARPDDAAASLYRLHRARIYSYCLGQLRDRQEADDAVQSTFLYAFASLQRGVQPKAALPWLYTIAHNVCRTRRRALKRRSRLESDADLDTLHESVGRDDPQREDVAGLSASLAALPRMQRQALLLREWQGLSYSEIAARLELTESAVEGMLFRARRNLAEKLQYSTGRLASLLNADFLIRGARRLVSIATATKPAAGAIAVGMTVGATLVPLADTSRAPIRVSAPISPVVAVNPTTNSAPSPSATKARGSAHVTRHRSASAAVATSFAPLAAIPDAAAPTIDAPTGTEMASASPAPAPAPAAAATPTTSDRKAAPFTVVEPSVDVIQGAGDASQKLVDTTQSTVEDVKTAVDKAVNETVPSVVSTVTNALPQLPLPPTKGTLLEGRP